MMFPLQGHRVHGICSRQGARDLQLRIRCQFRCNGILGCPVLPGSYGCQSTDIVLHTTSHDGLERHDAVIGTLLRKLLNGHWPVLPLMM
jgi:hypothetical protein